jgi:hypothetical protein
MVCPTARASDAGDNRIAAALLAVLTPAAVARAPGAAIQAVIAARGAR